MIVTTSLPILREVVHPDVAVVTGLAPSLYALSASVVVAQHVGMDEATIERFLAR